jgi:C1A family cysteine protease
MSRFGWKGSGVPDQRDLPYSFGVRLADPTDLRFQRVEEPPVKDLIIGPVCDQAALGSCGPFASTGVMVATAEENTGQPQNLSQLFLYYRYRERFGHVEYDDGVFNRELTKVLAEDGVCLEEDWPYILANWDKEPPLEAYEKGKLNRIVSYHALYTLDDMIQCIASGYSFFGGIVWYESGDSLYTEKTGLIEMPVGKRLGGHDLQFSKYNKNTGLFGGPNSWGKGWGDNGKFTIPFEYLTDPLLAGDFWTIR